MKNLKLKAAWLLGLALIAGNAAAYTYTTQVTLRPAGGVNTSKDTGTLVLGYSTGQQIGFDENEIQARAANGGPSTLHLNHGGGTLEIGSPVIDASNTKDLYLASDASIYEGGEKALTLTSFSNGLPILDLHGVLFTYQQSWFNQVVFLKYLKSDTEAPLCLGDASMLHMCPSSARYKRDVSGLSQGLSTVMAMRPVAFTWKTNGRHDIGFIAEEAESVVPELVIRDGDGVVQSFQYQHFTAVLTRAVQEQQGAIETLRGELHASSQNLESLGEELTKRDREIAAQRHELDAQTRQIAALRREMGELSRAMAGLAQRR